MTLRASERTRSSDDVAEGCRAFGPELPLKAWVDEALNSRLHVSGDDPVVLLSMSHLYSRYMPTGGDLHVELEQLSRTASWLDKTERELADRRAKLQREADDVLDGSWRGVPATKVRDSWDEWVSGYDRVMKALEDSRQLLETARAEYGEQDASTATSLNATTTASGHLNLDY